MDRSPQSALSARAVTRLDDVDGAQFDALGDPNNPFVTHAFLSLLERTGCVGPGTPWLPRHLLVTAGRGQEDAGASARLVAAMPLYLRADSRGEYIFDWAWAEAAQRAGIAYYPKLLGAVPFTPATGPRVLSAPDTDRAAAIACLASALAQLERDEGASSTHVLFLMDDEATALCELGFMRRASLQFHWRNAGYRDFEDFLGCLRHEERKQIRRERRRVREAGIEIEVTNGRDLPRALWPTLFQLYTSTSDRKWGRPYLNADFFAAIPEVLGESSVVALARRGGNVIAMTLSFERGRHLYGRYWGALEDVPGLHFELCYYALIERAIARGYTLVEAGAQGEHKLKRGFLPVRTHSVHTVQEPTFRRAIARFLKQEEQAVSAELAELLSHSPFKDGAAPNLPPVAGLRLD